MPRCAVPPRGADSFPRWAAVRVVRTSSGGSASAAEIARPSAARPPSSTGSPWSAPLDGGSNSGASRPASPRRSTLTSSSQLSGHSARPPRPSAMSVAGDEGARALQPVHDLPGSLQALWLDSRRRLVPAAACRRRRSVREGRAVAAVPADRRQHADEPPREPAVEPFKEALAIIARQQRVDQDRGIVELVAPQPTICSQSSSGFHSGCTASQRHRPGTISTRAISGRSYPRHACETQWPP